MTRSQVKYAVALKKFRLGTDEDGNAVNAEPGQVIDVTDWRGNAVDSNIGTGNISLLPTDPDALRTLADSIEEAQQGAQEASEERQRRLKKPKVAAEDSDVDDDEADADSEGDDEESDPSEDGDGEDEDDDAEDEEDELPEGLTEGENGWYTASDGEKVRGREAAVEYQRSLNEDDEDDADE